MTSRGFTLLELQASLFVGTLVVMLAGSLLLGEHARQIRLEQRARLVLLQDRVDGTLQWACFQAEALELAPTRIVFQARDGLWSLGQDGLTRDLKPLLRENEGVQLTSAKLSGQSLTLNLDFRYGEERERVTWRYHLGTGVLRP